MGTTTTAFATALRRIDKLEAGRRRVSRSLDRCTPGSELARELAQQRDELDAQIARWRAFVTRAEAEGLKIWSREDFSRGDFVRYRNRWYEVLRVNTRSLTVPHALDGAGLDVVRRGDGDLDWTWTIGYHAGITGRMDAEAMARDSK
jgi:hypothetical protein